MPIDQLKNEFWITICKFTFCHCPVLMSNCVIYLFVSVVRRRGHMQVWEGNCINNCSVGWNLLIGNSGQAQQLPPLLRSKQIVIMGENNSVPATSSCQPVPVRFTQHHTTMTPPHDRESALATMPANPPETFSGFWGQGTGIQVVNTCNHVVCSFKSALFLMADPQGWQHVFRSDPYFSEIKNLKADSL
jgi:hypothetical protein